MFSANLRVETYFSLWQDKKANLDFFGGAYNKRANYFLIWFRQRFVIATAVVFLHFMWSTFFLCSLQLFVWLFGPLFSSFYLLVGWRTDWCFTWCWAQNLKWVSLFLLSTFWTVVFWQWISYQTYLCCLQNRHSWFFW